MSRVSGTILLMALAAGLALGCSRGGGGDPGRDCTVDSVSPAIGDPVGAETVTIEGSGFQFGMQVVFGTSLSPSVTVLDSWTATAETPPSPVDAVVDVAVILPSGRTDVLEDGYTYDGPCLQGGCPGCLLWAVLPDEGPLAGGATVSILGAGFVGGEKVVFGTTLSPQVTLISWNEIRAITPPSPIAGWFDVRVLSPASGSLCTLPDGYGYGAGCALTDVSPLILCSLVQERVTITGSGFQEGAVVEFLSQMQPIMWAQDVTVIDENTIEALTPPPPSAGHGPMGVQVVNPDGRTCFLPDAVTFEMGPPTPGCGITGIQPIAGSTAGGETVVISGFRLAETDRVLFGADEALSVTLLPTGDLEVITPPSEEPGPVIVYVTDRACSHGCLFQSYTYQ